MFRTDLFRLMVVGVGAGVVCQTALAGEGRPNPLGLIPTPQQIRPIKATFEFDEHTPILLSSRATPRQELTARLLRSRISQITGLHLPIVRGSSGRGIRLLLAGTPEGTAVLTHHRRQMPIRPLASAKGWATDYQHQQEYFLHVSPAGAVVVANAQPGLLHGIATLAQLITPEELILGCEVHDWPEMRFRGLHLRLDGPPGCEQVRPTCGQIKLVIETMARFKMNHLLLEPGAGAELPSMPGAGRLEALTAAQQQEIRRFAEAFGVHVVPVLTSWSDVEGWRARPLLGHLMRDGRLDLDQPEAIDVLARMAADLDRNLNTSEFVHLGGRGASKSVEAYVGFHARLIERVGTLTGKRPLLWGMSRTTPAEVIARWPAQVVILPDHATNPRGGWYREGVRVPDVWAAGLTVGRSQIALATPLGTSRSDDSPLVHWRRCERHLTLWAEAVYRLGRDDGGLGMVATLRGCSTGAQTVEAALPQICWLAELSWNDARAGDLPDRRFDRAVGWHLCGVASEGERVLNICRRLGEPVPETPDPGQTDPQYLTDALRELRQIHFGTRERAIGDALREAAAMVCCPGVPPTGSGPDGRSRSLTGLPIAVAAGAKTGRVGRRIQFDASGSRDAVGGRRVQASWEFGDGARSRGLRVHHVYTNAGTYVASLTITDATGASRREPLLVTIMPATPAVADGRGLDVLQ